MRYVSLMFSMIIIMSAAVVEARDCTISKTDLLAYKHGRMATKLEWRQSSDTIERLMTNCPAGPADSVSRSNFFELVDLAFKAGQSAGRESDPDRSEAAWESANQLEYDLRQYMDQIVDEGDIEFKSVILKTANARAISRLGPGAKYDVLREVHIANPVTIGAGHHSAYVEGILALGFWIDPVEKRFNADEKREMTDVLLTKAATYYERVDYGQTMNAEATLKALGHATSPQALEALQKWTHSRYPSLREAAQSGSAAVKVRLQQLEQ